LDGHGESHGCPGSLLFSYQGEIARRQNDARIAGNHALLAAASEQFADYLSDVWADAKEDVRQFAEVDLGDLVEETAGAVEEEQPSEVANDSIGFQSNGRCSAKTERVTACSSTLMAMAVIHSASDGIRSARSTRRRTGAWLVRSTRGA